MGPMALMFCKEYEIPKCCYDDGHRTDDAVEDAIAKSRCDDAEDDSRQANEDVEEPEIRCRCRTGPIDGNTLDGEGLESRAQGAKAQS